MTTEKRNDEIDLIEVFQKMGNGIIKLFKNLLNLLYLVMLFFIRRAILICILCIIALGLGLLSFKTSERYYSSSLKAYTNVMSSLDMINYINNINELFKQRNEEGLLSKLSLTKKTLEKVKGAKAYKVIDFNKDGVTDLIDYKEKYKSSDTSISRTQFAIKVKVFDQDVLPLIEESILNYINENKYINELNAIRKRQLFELIAKLENEILTLDSLKKREYFTKEGKVKTQRGQLLVMNEKATQLYHNQIISLYKQKQRLEHTLELRTDPITIIESFSALSTIENKLSVYLKFYGIIGFLFGALLSLIIENFRVIKRVVVDSKRKR